MPSLYQEIATLKQDIRDEDNKIKQTNETITKVKSDLRTSIDIATKYEQNITSETENDKFEDDGKDLMQLMLSVNALEVELASGMPQEIVDEQTNYKKIITKLDKLKKRMEKQRELTVEMRSDLKRVQNELIARREKVEESIDKLSEDINKKNEEITRWLSLAASMKSTKEVQHTLISSLREKYYH